MKRKHLYYILSLLLLVAGCDIIDEKDRVIQTDELHFTNKIVLLEDFTGHKCVNCPVAADEIARLEEWCEGHLIAVSIHAGSYANTSGSAWKTDFRTKAGEAYNDYFKPDGYPAAMVDRVASNGKVTNNNVPTWSSQVIDRLSEESPVEIKLEAVWQPGMEEIKLHAAVDFLRAVGNEPVLQLWIIEDHIVDAQLMPDNTINTAYLHRHVFRDAINDSWGESMGTGLTEGATIKKEYVYQPDITWKKKDLQIVAFVYDRKSHEILQAVKTEIEQE